jgi:aminoglycoside phosphotransferase (APT) family kinase protein
VNAPRSLGTLIGLGRTAEVFDYGEGRVLKLLRPGFPARLVDQEATVAGLVDRTGLAGPRFFGRAEIDGRPGLMFERIDGESMLDYLTRRPWRLNGPAHQFASLHAQMHRVKATELPPLKDVCRAAIRSCAGALGPVRAQAALDRIDLLADGNVVCHGDMHPGNVMLTRHGAKVIDWMTAVRGPAEADVARSVFLISGSVVPSAYPRFQRGMIALVRAAFLRQYLDAYRASNPLDGAQLDAWRLPVLAARVAEGVTEERDLLLARIDALLLSGAGVQRPGKSS